MMNMPKHLTVVYTINDEAEFAPVRAEIMARFGECSGRAYAVTAISADNEVRRVELMEEAAARFPLDAGDVIEQIASHPDVGNVSGLDAIGH
jgi:hypothetical protein